MAIFGVKAVRDSRSCRRSGASANASACYPQTRTSCRVRYGRCTATPRDHMEAARPRRRRRWRDRPRPAPSSLSRRLGSRVRTRRRKRSVTENRARWHSARTYPAVRGPNASTRPSTRTKTIAAAWRTGRISRPETSIATDSSSRGSCRLAPRRRTRTRAHACSNPSGLDECRPCSSWRTRRPGRTARSDGGPDRPRRHGP